MKAAGKVIHDYQSFDKYKFPNKKSILRKQKRMSNLKQIICFDTAIDKEYDFKTKQTCFDPNIEEMIHEKKEDIIHYPVSQLEIIDEQNGIECRDTNDVLQFLLVPRLTSIHECGKKKTMETLQFLRKNRPQLKRGQARKNNFYNNEHSYVVFGKTTNRFGKGSIMSELKNDPNNFFKNRITKMMRSMERKVKMYLDPRLLNTLSYVKNELIEYDTICNSAMKPCQIWTSLSHAVNYHSACHVDEDFFLSSCSVNEDNGEDYNMKSKVITYFCFPTLNKAIALRDGDILIFNPLTIHCCSKKVMTISNDVHIYSMYLKSKHVSLNDNATELTTLQKQYLDNI